MGTFVSQITSLTPLATAIAFILFIVYQFLQNKSGAKQQQNLDMARESGVASEVITTYKEQVTQLKEQGLQREERFQQRMKEQSDSFQSQINNLIGKIGELTGQINEKNKQLEFFKELFENRNPELEEFIQSSKSSSDASMTYMKETTDILKEIHQFMKNINKEKVNTI